MELAIRYPSKKIQSLEKMKKTITYILLITLFFGCQKTIEFNNPAIQANFEGQSWQAIVLSATVKDGGLVVKGTRGFETLLLFTTRTDVGEYPLGGNNLDEARYISADGTMYSTLNAPDPSVQVFPSDGLIEILEFNTVENTVTGAFRFNAFTEDGLNTVNFIDGVFFEISLGGNIEESIGSLTCTDATTAVTTLETQISVGTPSVMLCTDYLAALQAQILSCGDADGSIQNIIDNLDCGDNDGDGVPNQFEDTNMDGILGNDDTDMDGIPNFMDSDDDGDGILTADEIGDTDADGIPNYLDQDDDGDGILSIFEGASMAQNTDGDTFLDYLDIDDDNDGALTADENADPNGDGNPDDAIDTDMNGTPDYLQV